MKLRAYYQKDIDQKILDKYFTRNLLVIDDKVAKEYYLLKVNDLFPGKSKFHEIEKTQYPKELRDALYNDVTNEMIIKVQFDNKKSYIRHSQPGFKTKGFICKKFYSYDEFKNWLDENRNIYIYIYDFYDSDESELLNKIDKIFKEFKDALLILS